MENDVLVGEVVTNDAVCDVVKETTKHVDLLDLGVKGLVVIGGATVIGGVAYGFKKLYNKHASKKNAVVVEAASNDSQETNFKEVNDKNTNSNDKKEN